MTKTVTIVMYHYVRERFLTRFPEIKGLDLSLFREQLAYIQRHYTVITAQELISAVKQNAEVGTWDLPSNALLLTFDDGYVDHFQNVFPLLEEAALQGSFFPSAKAIGEGKLLDVNKIHFILAAVKDKQIIVNDILRTLDEHRAKYQLEDAESFYKRLSHASRHDTAEVIFIKRALQVALPAVLREIIMEDLFKKYVSADEIAFAAELYMSMDQLRCMVRHGMYVGSHGYSHSWMGRLAPEEQAWETDESLRFLGSIGMNANSWIMCYPYGDVNESLLRILKERDCVVGLTTRIGIAANNLEPLLFPRLDTNDLPKQAQALPNAWAIRVA